MLTVCFRIHLDILGKITKTRKFASVPANFDWDCSLVYASANLISADLNKDIDGPQAKGISFSQSGKVVHNKLRGRNWSLIHRLLEEKPLRKRNQRNHNASCSSENPLNRNIQDNQKFKSSFYTKYF